jgi:hypothetical protein
MGKFKLMIKGLVIILASNTGACNGSNQTLSNQTPGSDLVTTATSSATSLPTPTLLKPQLGKIRIAIPSGWVINTQGVVKQKDKEVYTFTRQVDARLWANPGSFGTSNLPVMSMTVTLRDAQASQDDLAPQRLGESLVKQKVFTKLVTAKKLSIANREASLVVGDTLERNYTSIIMLASAGYLYKWTLDGVRETDSTVKQDFNTMLESAVVEP